MRKLLAILIFASCISVSAQTTTCGQSLQTGTDSGDALWQLGTPCTTGTNTGGYTVSSISYWAGTPASTSFSLGVYGNSAGTPGSLLCSVSTGTITPSSGWNTVNISSCPTLSASTTYWVGYLTGSNAISQGTVSGVCPGTSYHSTWANAQLPGVSLANPFPANTQGSTCYSLYMTLNPATNSPGPLTINTTALPNGQVGAAYSASLTATGGTTPYTWSLTSGTLPAGLSLNTTTGAITGTPTATANATSLTFKLTDSSSPAQTNSVTLSLTVNAAVTTTTCGQSLQTGTDSGDALWQLGTPCTTGTNTGGYTVSSISYWAGTPASTSFSLGVYGNSAGTPGSLLCSVSTGTITPSSGWNTVNISSCPTLSASTTYWVGYLTGSNAISQGTVSGVCPGTSYHSTWANAQLPGVSLANPFPANTQGSTCYSLYMTLNPATNSPGPLTINTTALPNGQVGAAYSTSLTATGGTTPYTWSLTSGTLPAGLSLNTTTGAITGTPTATANATSLTFKLTDSSSPVQTKTVTLSLTIAAATLTINTTALPNGQVGATYSASLTATGGTTPYTWSLTSGTLPAGLSLNTTTGAITGTPTATANATSLTFKLTDSSSPAQTNSVTLSLTVNAAVTTTTCGQSLQTGTDSGDALWQLGTPCTTGTNTGGYTVSSISYWAGTPASTSFSLGVYGNSAGTPGSLLCSVSTGTITPSSGWNTVNISSCPTLSASTTYWVGYLTGSNAISQGTVSGVCPGTSYHSTWANAQLPGVSLANPFPANTQGSTCYSLYMTLNPATNSPGPLTINTTALPNGQVGAAYSTSLTATGGTTPYTWSLTSGTLPAGLSLNTTTGAITGTPTATANATSLTFKLTDSSSPVQTKSATLSLTVNASGSFTVSVSPRRAGITINQILTLTATTTDSGGVDWSVTGSECSGSACGTFSSTTSLTGVAVTYTAPGTAGVYTVTATSASNGITAASVAVGVTDLAGVTTYHNDLARDGSNTQEYALNPTNVATSTFGKLFSCTVDEAVYAQPLWVPNLTINGVKRNVVFVATQNDSLYAFDADNNTTPCTPLWQVSLLDSNHGGTAGETSVPSSGTNHLVGYGNGDIAPEVGVTGTPVIDPSTNTLYVVSKSVIASGPTFFQRLHGIDLLTGNEKYSGPVNIAATYPGTGDNGTTTTFVAREENQRCGLALVNGVVYIAWAAHEDDAPYYGWIIGYNAGSPTQSTLTQAYVFNDDPNKGLGGIWMSGGAPSADASGNLYVITGNGVFDATSGTAPNNDYGDSFLELTGSLSVEQYFTPSDQSTDNMNDQDFGAGGAAVLADLPANGSNPTHLVVGGGKDGALYLLNRDPSKMGGSGDSNAWQRVQLNSGIFSTGAFWNDNFYLATYQGKLVQYTLNPSTAKFGTTAASSSSEYFGLTGASPSVTSMPDNSNGIVWALDITNYCTPQSPGCGPTILHAYSAATLNTEYWNSTDGTNNTGGNAVKFTIPTVANGKVYVGTRGNNAGGADNSTSIPGQLDVYGLLP